MIRRAKGGRMAASSETRERIDGADLFVQLSGPSYAEPVPGGVICRTCGTGFWGEPAIAHGGFYSHNCRRS